MNAYLEARKYLPQVRPDLWHALHPRTYRGAELYGSPEVPATLLGSTVASYQDGLYPLDTATICVALTAGALIKHRTTCWFVGRELLLSLDRTEPPKGLRWPELHYPFPAGVLLFPKGFLKSRGTGWTYDWCSWCLADPAKPMTLPGQPQQFAPQEKCLIFLSGSQHDPRFAGLTLSRSESEAPDFTYEVNDYYGDGLIMDDDESLIIQKLASICVSVIMLSQARPEYIEVGQRIRKIKDGPARELWSPTFVGQNYRFQREHQGGTHASPRLHWRRGHWRNQAHGAGRELRKLLWIEPILIGGAA